jgi:serine/threonine-protein kinase
MGTDAIDVGGPLTAIAFGVTHECFIRGGRLYCVGGNDFSALGTSPTALCGAAMSPCAPTPQTVDSGDTDWAVIGSGPVSFHTCAAGATGVSCWGRNDHHQAGPSTGDVTAPMPIPALAAAHVTAISTGVTSTCVVADGAVYCWGLNDHGQLGTAPGAASATPVHVPVP